MKKWVTLVFALVFGVGMSMPAWSQSTGTNKQTTTTEKKADKDAKKESSKKKKADKKAAAKKGKEDKQNTNKDASKK